MKSSIAAGERDAGGWRTLLQAHNNSGFLEPPYLCFPRGFVTLRREAEVSRSGPVQRMGKD